MHPMLQFGKVGYQQSKNSQGNGKSKFNKAKTSDRVRTSKINKIDLTLTKSCFLQGRKSLFRNILISLQPWKDPSILYSILLNTAHFWEAGE